MIPAQSLSDRGLHASGLAALPARGSVSGVPFLDAAVTAGTAHATASVRVNVGVRLGVLMSCVACSARRFVVSSMRNLIELVGAGRSPREVVQRAVARVAVDVPALVASRAWTSEGQQDKLVDIKSLPLAAIRQDHHRVPATVAVAGAQDYPASQAADSSLIAYFVQSLVPRYGEPSLSHNNIVLLKDRL